MLHVCAQTQSVLRCCILAGPALCVLYCELKCDRWKVFGSEFLDPNPGIHDLLVPVEFSPLIAGVKCFDNVGEGGDSEKMDWSSTPRTSKVSLSFI